MKENQYKVIVVAGGLSGIGRAFAEFLANLGHTVYYLSRNDFYSQYIIPVVCDLSDEKQVENAVGKILFERKRIDVLICDGGIEVSGVEDYSALTVVSKIMKNQNSGRIVGISVQDSYFSPLSKELKPYGISVSCVRIGKKELLDESDIFSQEVLCRLIADISLKKHVKAFYAIDTRCLVRSMLFKHLHYSLT